MTEHRKLAVHRLDSSEPVILWQHGSAWRSGSSKRTRWSMTERNRIVKCVSLLPVGRLDARATSGTSFAVLPDNGLAALSVDDETPTDTCQRMTRSVRRLHKCLGERLCILSAAPWRGMCSGTVEEPADLMHCSRADCPVRSCAAAWCCVERCIILIMHFIWWVGITILP
jgi:hypothetical protein